MVLLHFDSHARLEHDVLVLMTRALRTLREVSPVDDWPPAVTDGVSGVLKWLLAVAGVGVVGPAAVRKARRSSSEPTAGLADAELGSFVIHLASEEVLDHAAALLDASVLLHRGGLHAHAFALEGVQGRLLEATVGAGSVERR